MLKHKKPIIVLLVLFLLVALSGVAVAVASGLGEPLYIHSAELTDDLTYTNTVAINSSYGREESYQLTLSPSDIYPIVMACDTIYGGMSIVNIVKYAQTQGYNVIAALNSDFFNMSTGVPLGIVIENGVFKSSSRNHTAVSFDSEGNGAVSAQVTVGISLTNKNNGSEFELERYNKMRANGDGLYLLNEYFSTVSTRTSSDGWMVRLKVLDGKMTVNGKMRLEVTELIEGAEAQPIGAGYMILTADTTSNMHSVFEKFNVGDVVELRTSCDDPAISRADWATGAGDILAVDGELTDASGWDPYVSTVGPRSAFGIKADGTMVFYEVDGRKTAHSNGLTRTQLAREILAQGCVTVVNLDGGGSSALGLRLPGDANTTTVNVPSEGAERRCSTYILLVTDRSSNGSPRRLHLAEDGALVLSGTTLKLNCLATDSSYSSAIVPDDVQVGDANLGVLDDVSYTAGSSAGTETLTLYSDSTGARGTAQLHIVESVDSLCVNGSDGKELSSLRLKCGDSVQLSVVSTYHGRKVVTSGGSYSYRVMGDIGTVTADGIFTASDSPGVNGTITVSGGGRSAVITVKILPEFRDIKGHWAEMEINALLEREIVGGTSGTTYSPELNIRRADFVLMLYRAVGQPAQNAEASFTDVSSDKYYAAAVAWAESNGVAQGGGDGKFMPEQNLTREQAFTFIYRALPALGISCEVAAVDVLSSFDDSTQITEYALIPIATLVQAKLVNGSNNQLNPAGKLTRAQMAKLLYAVVTR